MKRKNNPKQTFTKVFPIYPFKSNLKKADDYLFFGKDHSESEIFQKAGGGVRFPLGESDLQVLDSVVGSRKLSRIRYFLVKKCNIQNFDDLSWSDIIDYINSWQEDQVGKETKSNLTKATPQSIKELKPEARQAYLVLNTPGLCSNQTEAAEILSKQLGRPVSQGQVSRWLKATKQWMKQTGLPIAIEGPKSKPVLMDNETIDLGRRTDGKRMGDPCSGKTGRRD